MITSSITYEHQQFNQRLVPHVDLCGILRGSQQNIGRPVPKSDHLIGVGFSRDRLGPCQTCPPTTDINRGEDCLHGREALHLHKQHNFLDFSSRTHRPKYFLSPIPWCPEINPGPCYRNQPVWVLLSRWWGGSGASGPCGELSSYDSMIGLVKSGTGRSRKICTGWRILTLLMMSQKWQLSQKTPFHHLSV